MQNLRLYGEETVYMSEKNTHEYPTVSYVEDTKKVFYQSKPNYVRTKMIVESTDGLTPYIGSSFDLTQMEYIEVTYEDGTTEKVDMSVEPTSYYTFTQTGDVVVDIYLKKDWNNASYMFACNTEIIPVYEIDFTHCKTNKVTDMSYMFNNLRSIVCVGSTPGILENIIFGNNFDTSNVTNMNGMFSGCTKLTSLDLSNFDTSNVTNTNGMFDGCTKLTSLDLSNFDTSNVTNTNGMFDGCESLTTFKYFKKTPSKAIAIPNTRSVDFSCWDTSNVTNMSSLCNYCTSLTSVTFGENFDTSKVTNMASMFYKCSGLTSLDLRSFDTSNVTDMGFMFNECDSLTSLDVSNFNTSNVTYMGNMFSGCKSLTSLDLSSFNTSNVSNMYCMFSNCSGLTSVTFGSQADVSKVTDYSYMFRYITTTGTLYYPSAYVEAWNNIIVTHKSKSSFPSTWTPTAIDYEN